MNDRSNAHKQLAAFSLAFISFVAAIVLRAAKIENWLVLSSVCLSVGFVAFILGCVGYNQRKDG
jgi:hypothetical protein